MKLIITSWNSSVPCHRPDTLCQRAGGNGDISPTPTEMKHSATLVHALLGEPWIAAAQLGSREGK